MYGKLFQLGVSLILAGVLIGCKTPAPVQTKDHPDPLCHSKIPIEGQAHDAEPDAAVRVDPQPPPIPNQPGGVIVRQRALWDRRNRCKQDFNKQAASGERRH